MCICRYTVPSATIPTILRSCLLAFTKIFSVSEVPYRKKQYAMGRIVYLLLSISRTSLLTSTLGCYLWVCLLPFPTKLDTHIGMFIAF